MARITCGVPTFPRPRRGPGNRVPSETGPQPWAGVQRSQPVDWSMSDRLVLWVLVSTANLPLTFNVTAYVGPTFHTTQSQSLAAGWQEVVVDLTQLGSARSGLVSLQLRLYGPN